MKSRIKRQQHGLSLVEGLVTVCVVGVLAAVAIPNMSDMLDRRRVENVAQEFASDARLAYSLARTTGESVWLQPMDTCYNIQRVTGLVPCQCKAPTPLCQPGGAAYGGVSKAVDLSDAWVKLYPSNVVNNALYRTFTVTSAGLYQNPSFVEVAGTRGARLRVNITAVGRTTICVVNGNFSAYPSC